MKEEFNISSLKSGKEGIITKNKELSLVRNNFLTISKDIVISTFSKNFDDINLLLKSTASPNRIEILMYLLENPRSLQFFLEKLQIKRTTLIHHVNSLMEAELVERIDRGKYSITELGINFGKAIVVLFQSTFSSNHYGNNHKLSKLIVMNNETISESDQKIVTKEAVYDRGWISYVSTAAGILNSMDTRINHKNLAGRSGFCFLTTSNHLIEVSYLPNPLWNEIYKGTRSFGYDLIIHKEPLKHPRYSTIPGELNLGQQDYNTSLKIFNEVKQIIDTEDTPIGLLGIHGCGYAIINGYTEDSYIVSTYFHFDGLEEVEIKFNDLKLLNEFAFFYFKPSDREVDESYEDQQSIFRAINMAEGNFIDKNEFATGLVSYDIWIQVIDTEDYERNRRFAHNNLSNYYRDTKEVCSQYLKELAVKYQNKSQQFYLAKSSDAYYISSTKFNRLSQLYPKSRPDIFLLPQKLKLEAVNLLQEIKLLEYESIEYLKKAYDVWE